MRSRKGSSLLEVIVSLGIITVLLIGVSRYVWLLSGMEVRNKDKAKWKDAGDVFYEEIMNLDQIGFVEMMAEIRDSEEVEILNDQFTQIEEVSVKTLFQGDGESLNTFFVTKMRDDDVYVKVSFRNIDFNRESFGLEKIFSIGGSAVQKKYRWKQKEDCDIIVESTENVVDGSFGFKVSAGGISNSFNGFESDEYTAEISLGEGWLKFNAKSFQPVKTYVGDEDGDVFISSEMDQVKRFTIENNSDRLLSIYVDGMNMELNTIGDNILIYSNDSGENPGGNSNVIEKVTEFEITVYTLLESGIIQRFHINGFKKIERFSI